MTDIVVPAEAVEAAWAEVPEEGPFDMDGMSRALTAAAPMIVGAALRQLYDDTLRDVLHFGLDTSPEAPAMFVMQAMLDRANRIDPEAT